MTKSARWGLAVALVAIAGVVLVLVFVLSLGATGSAGYERHFVWLLWMNLAVAVLLLAVIAVAALRLATRVRRGKFGSRLLAKLAATFALVGVLPGLAIYAVSYQFVVRSIEAWFDARLAGALEAGLALGRSTLDSLQADVAYKARFAAERLVADRAPGGDEPAELRSGLLALRLERLREQTGVGDLILVGANGQILVTAGGAASSAPPERPSALLLRQARADGAAVQIEGLDEEALARPGAAGARVRALARVLGGDIRLADPGERYLMVVQEVPRALAANALAVQAASSEYQQRALAHRSLRRLSIGTLTLALVLTVFGAVLLAIVLGNRIARPLLLLAEGVREVAAGDLRPKPVFASADELGGLTRDFAQMTAQLADARAQVERGVAQLERARTRLQTILDTLTPGVIVFDRDGRIETVNPGAMRILRLPIASVGGGRPDELPELAAFVRAVEERFRGFEAAGEPGERDAWQDSFELERGDGALLTLVVRGAPLPGGERLLVFDDITEVVSAQRSAAWAEVARRLAHEIKNPLTPIQLSAERLRMKLESKLDGADRALLLRSVATIVAQVQAMQTLVNEFRDYARLPAAQMKALDLNALVAEVLALYGEAVDSGRLAAHLEEGLPRIVGDATQLRQVVHNLVQNALDATAEAGGHVEVATSARHDGAGLPQAVRLVVGDDGPGFAEKVLKRAFEPYVTTKARGTGLGLAVVRKIAEEHGALLRATNVHADDDPGREVLGARVSLSFSRLATVPAGVASPAGAAPDTGGRDPSGDDEGRSGTGDAAQLHRA